MGATKARTARKARQCDQCCPYPYNRTIQPGDRYLVHTAFPSDMLGHNAPAQIAECAGCARLNGRGELLEVRG